MAAFQLVAGEPAVVLGFGAAAAALVALTTLAAVLVVEVARDGDDVRGDVQRFVELSAAAHALLPDGPLLSDPQGEASAAIGALLARKDEARRALWASSDAILPARRPEPAPATVSRFPEPRPAPAARGAGQASASGAR